MIDPDTERLLRRVNNAAVPDIERIPLARRATDTTMMDMMAALARARSPPPPAGRRGRQIEVPTPSGAVAVRLYRPAGRRAPAAAVWIHGGGFVLGEPRERRPVARELCAGAGVLVASVDYPLAPEHP